MHVEKSYPHFIKYFLKIICRKHDAQGQITEMRFNLTLLLHQIEQTLQEFLSQMILLASKAPEPTQKIIDESHKSEMDISKVCSEYLSSF